MPEVHVPNLEDEEETDEGQPSPAVSAPLREQRAVPRGRSITRLLLEVALIAAGVFLGLAGEQWRENVSRRDEARVALERFREEVAVNRTEVVRVMDYHTKTRASLKTYLAADPEQRKTLSLKLEGVQIAHFERTAWDLALSTGALADVDHEIAFNLSRIYNAQNTHASLSQGLTQAMYIRPPAENLDGFLAAMAVYFDDVVLLEPQLLDMYNGVLPMLDSALRD